MYAHANADRLFGESVATVPRSRKRRARVAEGDEEGIPLGIDLDAAVGGERRAQHSAMILQRLPITIGAELM
jgi:hypothetical protein